MTKAITKHVRLIVLAVFCLSLAACAASSIFSNKVNHRVTFDEGRLNKGQGAVMMHALNRGSLIATRWYKINDPDKRYSFTVYRSDRHRAIDRMDSYDLVMVEPGTYVLYSVFSNCEEGLRPLSTDYDETMRSDVASPIGMVTWLRTWKPGGDVTTGLGIWGGSGGNIGGGTGAEIGAMGTGAGPGLPVATCNLLSPGMVHGRPALATITVKPGEIVYAGEIFIDYGADSRCDDSGNWMTDNETRSYCGADWVKLRVADSFSSHGRAFLEKALGPNLAKQAVVRLAEPGSQVSAK